MTREEAIQYIDGLHIEEEFPYTDAIADFVKERNEAIDMAIEALKRKPILCSHCKHYIRHDHRCGWWNHGVSNVDWCSYAERREE